MHFPTEWILPIFLYAETHYKFKGIFSRLFKKEPEIVADAPFRIDAGKPIPVLIFVKDAHRYPIELEKIQIEIGNRGETRLFEIKISKIKIDEKFWHRIFFVDLPESFRGDVKLDVGIEIRMAGKPRRYRNDNYRISSHLPLRVFVSDEPVPRFQDLYFGDVHWHSYFTEDMVEFGAPVETAIHMAQALGLDFFAVTDHSYDLDDQRDNWLVNDAALPKWHAMKKEIEELNKKNSGIIVLTGEEVSVGNRKNRNVHFLVINSEKFFPGKGDGAEKWLRTKPDLSLTQILEQLSPEALAIAAHPEIAFPLLQRLLLRRGDWAVEDFQHPRLNGYQIWNGERDRSFFAGSETWEELLLSGKRIALLAGNDAHGNFNRFRQIGFPFWTFRETNEQIFGLMRSGVLARDGFNTKNLLQAIRQGKTIVTNGPVAELVVENESGERAEIGDEIRGGKLSVFFRAISSAEFGSFVEMKIIFGDLNQKRQIDVFNFAPENLKYEFETSIQFAHPPSAGFFRAEVTTKDERKQIFRCLTSPIYTVGK
ncbi:MAG: CehA/McbA family metallohydrolase [Calditrichaeota bacterium]|nr:CehA/McbA family metallohydrolase [Calditrichota bacterium]